MVYLVQLYSSFHKSYQMAIKLILHVDWLILTSLELFHFVLVTHLDKNNPNVQFSCLAFLYLSDIMIYFHGINSATYAASQNAISLVKVTKAALKYCHLFRSQSQMIPLAMELIFSIREKLLLKDQWCIVGKPNSKALQSTIIILIFHRINNLAPLASTLQT